MSEPDNRNVADFLERHQGIVSKIARAFAYEANDFDDLFQEICICLWTAMDRIPKDVKESTYVYRVALNRAISLQRKKKSYVQSLARFWSHRSHLKTDVGCESSKAKTDLLYTAIRQLSDSDRSLVLLYLEKHNAIQISEILGMKPEAVRKRISRVKVKLTKLINQLENNNDH